MELYAGNERAHRHVHLPGLEGDVIALPSEGREGGDLYALFSCGGERIARIVLADAVGHGFSASRIAAYVHRLLHELHDIRDTGALLAALNDAFLASQKPGAPLRLTTVATANYDGDSGDFSYSYAAHPRMLLWRATLREWLPLGGDLEGGLPLGVTAGEVYSQQNVRLEPGDMVMAFSDAVTEVKAPDDTQFTAERFQHLAGSTASGLPHPISLHDLSEGLLKAIGRYHNSDKFEDDLTLLTLRRLS